MNHAIDDRDHVAADADHKATGWQLLGSKVNLAPLPDLHCRDPFESQLRHVVVEPLPLGRDAISRGAFARAALLHAFRHALRGVPVGETLVDLGIWPARSDGHGTRNAITCIAFEAGSRSAAIVHDPWTLPRLRALGDEYINGIDRAEKPINFGLVLIRSEG